MEGLVSDIPAKDGKIANLFLQCSYLVYLGSWCGHYWPLASWPK
jgi:hypothetical protein